MAPTRSSFPKPPARSAGAPRSRPSASTPRRTPTTLRRRKPEPESNAKKIFGVLSAALPGLLDKAAKPPKKGKPSSKKRGAGAGLALAGAGAGFAALRKRSKSTGDTPPPYEPAPVVPTTNGTSEAPFAPSSQGTETTTPTARP